MAALVAPSSPGAEPAAGASEPRELPHLRTAYSRTVAGADGLKAERDFAGRRSSYAYDANGNQTAASEAQSIAGDVLTIASSFNGFDELAEVRTPKPGGANQWVSRWTYDRHGNVESLLENQEDTTAGALVSAGRGFAYTYTDADEPLLQTDDFATPANASDDERFQFGFDAAGRLATRTLAKSNGAGGWTSEQTATRTYYANGALKTLQTLDAISANVASHALTYITAGVYLNGNLVSDAFRLRSPDAGASCQTADCTASWSYDGRDRLLSENTGTGSTSSFTLDVKGNIEAETRNGSPYRTATYTGARLATDTVSGFSSRYLYDAYGNVDCVVEASWVSPSCPTAVTGQTVAAALLSDNVYDYRDRLVAVRNYSDGTPGNRSEYRYDPLARPTRKISTVAGTTTTTEMVYLGVGDQVIRETESGTPAKDRRYAFDALGQRATLSENGSRYSYVVDQRESVVALLDQTNGIKASYGYRAYGEANPSLTKTAGGFNASTNLYRYTGKRFDPGARAYDMGARHYFPAQARWFQQDVYADALDNLGLSADPLNSNRYLFTGANPINNIEIDGHAFKQGLGGGGGIGRPVQLKPPKFVQRLFGGGGSNAGKPRPKEHGPKTELHTRADELSAKLDTRAQNHRTTAVVRGTMPDGSQRVYVASSAPRGLTPQQRAELRPGEVEVRGRGHAEVKAMRDARGDGATNIQVGASRPICHRCRAVATKTGATLTSPLKRYPNSRRPELRAEK